MATVSPTEPADLQVSLEEQCLVILLKQGQAQGQSTPLRIPELIALSADSGPEFNMLLAGCCKSTADFARPRCQQARGTCMGRHSRRS